MTCSGRSRSVDIQPSYGFWSTSFLCSRSHERVRVTYWTQFIDQDYCLLEWIVGVKVPTEQWHPAPTKSGKTGNSGQIVFFSETVWDCQLKCPRDWVDNVEILLVQWQFTPAKPGKSNKASVLTVQEIVLKVWRFFQRSYSLASVKSRKTGRVAWLSCWWYSRFPAAASEGLGGRCAESEHVDKPH